MKNKRLVIENWYRFMKEADEPEEGSVEKLLKDMKEENPEAFAKMEKELEGFDITDDPEAMRDMETELAKLDVDPHELTPDQLYRVLIKWWSSKQAGLITSFGNDAMAIGMDQEKFNKKYDVTDDGKFDLEDVKAFGDKTIPYGIYFGSVLTGGFQDEEVSTETSRVQVVSVPALFNSFNKSKMAESTYPWLVLYSIDTSNGRQFYAFDPDRAFRISRKAYDMDQSLKDESDPVQLAIKLCSHFAHTPDLFGQMSHSLEDETAELTSGLVGTDLSIKITKSQDPEKDKSILSQLLKASGVDSAYAFATEVEVKITKRFAGSEKFKNKLELLLLYLNKLPMLTKVKFAIKGIKTGKMEGILNDLLKEAKPHYSVEVLSTMFEQEEQILKDYEMIQKIKERKNG